MRAIHCVLLLIVTCVHADESEERRSKLPYIADAVGNSLPRPSNVPATVGSPVTLLNPDKYEFYTFDESGELIKRLMTLEEIQAIVAADDETAGLVTLSNDNKPTAALNFSQPSPTIVHDVVTNVQNVLKAVEANKNKTNVQPTLDTPDVTNSWSLILPSIFGNTGVDIIPDKTSESFITPETDTLDFENSNFDSESKEEDLEPYKSPNDLPNKVESSSIIPKVPSTTAKPTTTTTPSKTTYKTKKPIKQSSTAPTSTTPKIVLTTKSKKSPTTTTTSTTSTTMTTTTTTSTTTTTTARPKQVTSVKPYTTSTTKVQPTTKKYINTAVTTQTIKYSLFPTNKTPQFEKINTLAAATTVPNITEKTTEKPIITTKSGNLISSTLALVVSPTSTTKVQSINDNSQKHTTFTNENLEKLNLTTVTTQSVSPSTTVSSTEFIALQQNKLDGNEKFDDISNSTNNIEPILPLFDVAQSISQIASDLGGSYPPLPTTSSFMETKKENNLSLESKESLEIDIPAESGYENFNKEINNDFENYIKISTLDPHKDLESNDTFYNELNDSFETSNFSQQTTTVPSPNNIDIILNDSMGDMLSQVLSSSPEASRIDENNFIEEQPYTTESNDDTTTINNDVLSSTTVDYETTFIPITTDSIINSDETYDKKTKKTEELKTTTVIIDTTEKQTKNSIENDTETFIPTAFSTTKTPNTQRQTSSLQIDNKSSNKMETSTIISKTTSKMEPILNTIKKDTVAKNASTLNTLNAIKYPEEYPKIDEFKKKIQKVNIDDKELAVERNNSWKLVPTVLIPPQKVFELENAKQKIQVNAAEPTTDKNIILDFSTENQGLQVTTKDLGEDVLQFTELCNELAFKYWQEIIKTVDSKRSFVLSPYSITSMLAMMFMGARGGTSGEMNEMLKLDDMVTFNPHFTLKNISDSIETSSNAGVAISAFIRELFSDRNRGKILTFYKERAQHFYNGHVEEINFKLISDIIRRRTNLLVKRYTWGKVPEYIKTNSITMHSPLAAFSTNIFQTDCTGSSVDGRDGEMYFVVSPNVRQRRLVPVPSVVYKNNFLAGYDPALDATAAALGNTNSVITTLFLMPGQQGNVVNAEDIEALEKRFLDASPMRETWNRLLRTLLPRVGLELQIPRFSHKSMLNVSSALKEMGLKELFDSEHADLGGLIGPTKELHLSDMMQLTTFVTCGEGSVGEQHHIEEYPEVMQMKRRTSRWATMWDEPRDYQRAFHDPHDLGDAMHLPLHLRPRQARLPTRNSQPARLKFDRPFLYFVRHNPTGMILYVGRYNPRLLP